MDGQAASSDFKKAATSVSIADAGAYVAEALTSSGILDAETAQTFGSLFVRFTRQSSRKVQLDWDRIRPPGPDMLRHYGDLEKCPADEPLQHELLRKIAIVKLNGGLGTTMGIGRAPKSAIPVRSGLTFLDLTVRQIEYLNTKWGTDIPLVLMNSFRTHEATVKILNKYQHHNITITCFTQSCFPRIDRDHYAPLPTGPFTAADEQRWYPPGHGDVYRALDKSGVLDALLSQGKEYVFISNVDNLAATADMNILYHLVSNDVDFAMEVTERTRGDVQGGVLIEYAKAAAAQPGQTPGAANGTGPAASPPSSSPVDGAPWPPASSSSTSTDAAVSSSSGSTGHGRAKLVEIAQVPLEHINDFKSLKTFNLFNTNNLWVSLKAMKDLVSRDAILPPVIVNERSLGGSNVLELETAAGAAVEFFRKAIGIKVPRSRFLPVKNTSDLLAVQSDLYEVRHGSLVMSSRREVPTPPIIKLGPEFADLEGYSERLQYIPDMLELDHLTVSGNVYFGRGVVLRGTVIIVANEGARIDVPPGAQIENKVITGNLRILEH